MAQRNTPATSPNRAPIVTVLGLGQMGLVSAGILASPEPSRITVENAHTARLARPVRVRIWGHNADEAGRISQMRGTPRLPGFVLAPSIEVVIKDQAALKDADIVVSAVPVQYTRDVWMRLAPHVPQHAGVVSLAKGIENTTLLRPTQIIAQVLAQHGVDDQDRKPRPIACLSGPTIATELARCLPAAMIAASDDPDFARQIQQLFGNSWMRIYTNPDVLGVELAGAVKNVVAIAAGIVDGLQAGNNAKSALLARGLAELCRLGGAMGAAPETFFGIAGVGDLATTCFSPEGRNRSCGEALGQGRNLDEYLTSIPYVVEGVATARSLMELARKYRVDVPIISAVHAVLFENVDPIEAIGKLMAREQTAEVVG
jgi:glycerol-3-phosphate dehydrogenase (NAD(P)+)